MSTLIIAAGKATVPNPKRRRWVTPVVDASARVVGFAVVAVADNGVTVEGTTEYQALLSEQESLQEEVCTLNGTVASQEEPGLEAKTRAEEVETTIAERVPEAEQALADREAAVADAESALLESEAAVKELEEAVPQTEQDSSSSSDGLLVITEDELSGEPVHSYDKTAYPATIIHRDRDGALGLLIEPPEHGFNPLGFVDQPAFEPLGEVAPLSAVQPKDPSAETGNGLLVSFGGDDAIVSFRATVHPDANRGRRADARL